MTVLLRLEPEPPPARPRRPWAVLPLGLGLWLAACAPALDWRETRPGDGPLQALMPCKPATERRPAEVGGQRVEFALTACDADGHAYAVLGARLPDGVDVEPALSGFRTSLAATLGATEGADPGGAVPRLGLHARRFELVGRRPGGDPVAVDGMVFAHRGWVFRATVTGPRPAGGAAQVFFDGLRLPS